MSGRSAGRASELEVVLQLLPTADRWRMAVLAFVSLISGLLESAILVIVAQVAASMVDGRTRLVTDLGPLHLNVGVGAILAVALACAVGRVGMQVVTAYLPARIAADAQALGRMRLFDGYNAARWALQAEERDGGLQELLTSQSYHAAQGVVYAGGLLTSGLGFAALTASALVLSVPVALVVAAAAYLLWLLLRPLNRLARLRGGELSTTSVTFADGVAEAVRLSEETHVFGTAEAQRKRVKTLVDQGRHALFHQVFSARLGQYIYVGLAVLLIVGGLAGLYWSGTGRVGVLGAVVLMLVRSASYAQQALGNYVGVQQAAPFADRLLTAEARYREAALPSGGLGLDAVRSIRCDSVGYEYARGTAALVDVSLEVAAGESIGIVGPSGAGKSTLVQIVLRLREPTAGSFLVNGCPASDFSRADWHRLGAYVSQDPKLMHASVGDNILLMRELDDRAVERAARLAHIHDEVMSWPQGYDTIVGQRADGVSGGQRQRICLARALAAEPDLLVLDEPTSALDLGSEARIQASLASLRGRLTIFVVSHRLSTLAMCDRVVVLREGRVDAIGMTKDLEHSNAFYRSAAALTARGVR